MKKLLLGTAIATALGMAAGAANAASVSTGGAFTMYNTQEFDQAVTTPISASPNVVNIDGTISGFVDETAGSWGVSSTTLFNFQPWTASGGFLVSTPGDYALDTSAGTVAPATPDPAGSSDGSMHFTVGAGQLAGIIDFAWGTNSGIRVVDVWNIESDGSLTAVGVPGMENGPFGGFNAAFDLTAPGLVSTVVPIPAAAWLFGSAILGMVGVGRRKKKAA